jgi:predicted DNA-binding transcriptional regulator YafY
MNRTDRLLAIVLELQRAKRRRAADLAAKFETSKRTIYRDIQALSEAGVPVVATPGQGYSLAEGYFLPPLSFDADEAIVLLLGSDFTGRNFDSRYRQAAESVARKIEAVLPEGLRAQVGYLQESLHFVSLHPLDRPGEMEKLQALRGAILEGRSVQIRYHPRFPGDRQGRGNPREVDPYGLAFLAGRWNLTGYCHLRQDIRHFRLDRVDALEVLDRTFVRPASFRMERPDGERSRGVTVRALFDPAVVRWVRESPSYFTAAAETGEGGLLVTLRVHHEEEVLQWLLGWGARVRVLEPESLRRRLAEEGNAILRNHVEGETLLP